MSWLATIPQAIVAIGNFCKWRALKAEKELKKFDYDLIEFYENKADALEDEMRSLEAERTESAAQHSDRLLRKYQRTCAYIENLSAKQAIPAGRPAYTNRKRDLHAPDGGNMVFGKDGN